MSFYFRSVKCVTTSNSDLDIEFRDRFEQAGSSMGKVTFRHVRERLQLMRQEFGNALSDLGAKRKVRTCPADYVQDDKVPTLPNQSSKRGAEVETC